MTQTLLFLPLELYKKTNSYPCTKKKRREMDKPLKDCGSNDAAGDAAGDICNDTAGDSYNGSDDYDDM